MTRLSIFLLCFLLIISAFSCGGKKPTASPDNQVSPDPEQSDTSDEIPMDDLRDFPENVYEEMLNLFDESGMTLTDLKRNEKGNLVVASLDGTDAETIVPKAIYTLYQNFKSIDKVIIKFGKNSQYSLKVENYQDIKKSNKTNMEKSIWDAVSNGQEIAEEEKEKPAAQAAGL